ncbi:MAG: SDR family oxidoreductase [Prolixibacteraceae bacterium]
MHKNKDFENASYIIMGGTSGLGLASALALRNQGARVLAIGKDDGNLNPAKDKLGQECIVTTGEATDPETIKDAIILADKLFDGITGLFHVAGGSGRKFGDGPLDKLTLDGWNKTLELNLTSLMLSNQAMIQYFLEKKKPGIILNMSSVLACSPSPKYFATHAYAAAKSAIIGFTKSVAASYASCNIRLNVIAPALFETPMAKRAIQDDAISSFIKTKMPLDGGRAGDPDDLINPVLMFLSPSSKMITGQVLAVDGGWTVSEGQYQD